jgi:hypothetical protein
MKVPTVNERPILSFNLNRFPSQNPGSHLPPYLAYNGFIGPGEISMKQGISLPPNVIDART